MHWRGRSGSLHEGGGSEGHWESRVPPGWMLGAPLLCPMLMLYFVSVLRTMERRKNKPGPFWETGSELPVLQDG